MSEFDLVRRDTVARLCQAQASGLISVEAFEDRYALVREATSTAGLEALVADLQDESETSYALVHNDEPITLTEAVPVEPAESMRVSAVFGSASRAGNWTVPDHIEILIVAGEVTLDFRDAVFTMDTVVIDVSVTMGELKLIVPPGTQVENECDEILSSSSHRMRKRATAPPNGLLMVIRGRVRMGEVSVKERVPTGEEQPRFKPLIDKLLRRSSE